MLARKPQLCLAFVLLMGLPAAGDDAVDQINTRFGPLVKQCQQYALLTGEEVWLTKRLTRWQGPDKQWKLDQPDHALAEVVEVDGDPMIRLTIDEKFERGIDTGLTVQGRFGIEVEFRSTSEKPSNLSIVLDDLEGGPYFTYGMRSATSGYHRLRYRSDSGHSTGSTYSSSSRKVIKDHWYTNQMTMANSRLSAVVDGRRLMQSSEMNNYDVQKQRRVLICGSEGQIEIRSVKVRMLKPKREVDQAQKDAAWLKVFGEQTLEQINSRLLQLADQLEHTHFAVRERAQSMLKESGPLARPLIEKLTKTGSAEQRWRAKMILKDVDNNAEK